VVLTGDSRDQPEWPEHPECPEGLHVEASSLVPWLSLHTTDIGDEVSDDCKQPGEGERERGKREERGGERLKDRGGQKGVQERDKQDHTVTEEL
jgi:hypothetical protein